MMMTSVTSGIYPVRSNGGFKPGDMAIYMGRQTGKSMYMQMLKSRVFRKEVTFTVKKKSKYKFSRKTWYKVNMFVMGQTYDDTTRRIDWCTTHFGAQPKNPDAWTRWYFSDTTPHLVFRDLKDYQMYLLKWS